jgi:eukaryotic-like serine/threonine-protein kinase
MEAGISAPGTALGRFRIDGTLGRGGMAVVHLAHDTELGRPVALKLMADHCADDPAFRARFAREAQAAARLSHPNIVQVFDIGEEAGLPFIVMEYVDGETLGDTLARERRVAPDRVVEIARECCAGLACAHAAGLVHRDIKPQNLLVTTAGTIKIADFGVAHALDQTRLTLTGSIIGTARYLAPEQTAGGRPITPAADVYALGVVLYELLAGRPPHEGTSLPELAIAKRDDPVTPLLELRPEVGPELDAAVLACLAVSAEDRPTADDLAARLTPPDLHEQPTRVRAPTAATPPWSARPARRRRPRRVLAAVIAAAIVVVVLAFVVGLASSDTAKPPPPQAPTGQTPAQHAHNLAEWIRGHSR